MSVSFDEDVMIPFHPERMDVSPDNDDGLEVISIKT